MHDTVRRGVISVGGELRVRVRRRDRWRWRSAEEQTQFLETLGRDVICAPTAALAPAVTEQRVPSSWQQRAVTCFPRLMRWRIIAPSRRSGDFDFFEICVWWCSTLGLGVWLLCLVNRDRPPTSTCSRLYRETASIDATVGFGLSRRPWQH